ncbi:MAG: hypothetical protein JW939_00910 [Candidatus Thermoplasmatota archaeon]|nr:hypothetical protein [Candidatus Thermoplasmatota archaeon]
MLYCTKCGSDLKGNKARCPVCGYEVSKMEADISRTGNASGTVRPKKDQKPWAPPIPDGRKGPKMDEEGKMEEKGGIKFSIKVGYEENDSDPGLVHGCEICGGKPVHRCFFTDMPLCEKHTIYLQIYDGSMTYGEKVPSAPETADMKEGTSPTREEAEGAGVFFTIKHYHEWKRVKR